MGARFAPPSLPACARRLAVSLRGMSRARLRFSRAQQSWPAIMPLSGAYHARMAARRRTHLGDIELGVLSDLKSIPEYLREGGLARSAISLARMLDSGEIDKRDVPAMTRELRMRPAGPLDNPPRKNTTDDVDQRQDQIAARRAGRNSTS